MENGAASEGRDPSGFLGEIIGAPVTVKLNSGVVYKGRTSTQVRLGVTEPLPSQANFNRSMAT